MGASIDIFRFHRDAMERYQSFTTSFLDLDDLQIEAALQDEGRLKTMWNPGTGVVGLVVYPMNALITSQSAEIRKHAERFKAECRNAIVCSGTSATMAGGETALERKAAVAKVSTAFFGSAFGAEQVIEDIAKGLSATTSMDEASCAAALKALFSSIAAINERIAAENGTGASPKPFILPFKLHQFIAQSASISVSLHRGEERPPRPRLLRRPSPRQGFGAEQGRQSTRGHTQHGTGLYRLSVSQSPRRAGRGTAGHLQEGAVIP